jgi:hypothetical protein
MPKVKQAAFLCPTCGQPTRVLRTRSSDGHVLTRYRKCESGHRSTTFERLSSTIFVPVRLALRDVMNAPGPNVILDENQKNGGSSNERDTNSNR